VAFDICTTPKYVLASLSCVALWAFHTSQNYLSRHAVYSLRHILTPATSYSANLLRHLREVQTPDSPVGIYLSTHNGGFVTRQAVELLLAVEKVSNRGKAVVVIHDASRSVGGELSVQAYRLSDGAREAASKNKWDSAR
jgi:hypothetical protein